jgi:3',5'-cyclic AMP phosphodiesterase CpdA
MLNMNAIPFPGPAAPCARTEKKGTCPPGDAAEPAPAPADIYHPDADLKFNPDGTFKILQLTDLHFQPEESPAYAEHYKTLVNSLLDAEHPDMVVVTGDVLYWSGRPMKDYFDPALAPIIEHKIPWAFTMGNHDAESWFTGEDVMKYLETRPYSLCQAGPDELGASGNYPVEVHSSKGEKTDAVLYMLDSHDRHVRQIDYSQDLFKQLEGTRARPLFKVLEQKYGSDAMDAYRAIAALDRDKMAAALKDGLKLEISPGKIIRVNREDFVPQEVHGYDWLTSWQVRWYTNTSAEYTREAQGTPLPSVMFMHIPLPQFPSAWNTCSVGSCLEECSVQGQDVGMFSAIKEQHDVMGVFAGHDHLNDYVGSLDGVALGYGRKTGLSVYGPAPLERGGRVIVLHQNQRTFDTWIRTESGKVENKATIHDGNLPGMPATTNLFPV